MKLYLNMLVVLLFLLSCNKDKKDDTTVGTDRIKTTVTTVNGPSGPTTITYNYEYDNDGRVTKYTILEQNTHTDIAYNANMITFKSYNASNVLTNTTTCQVNAKGLVDQTTQTDGAITNYQYNSEGYLLKTIYTRNTYSYTRDYYYSPSKDLDSTVTSYSTGEINTEIFQDYLPGKKNTISDANFGRGYFGKPSSEPYAKYIYIPNYVNPGAITTYNYEFDGNGRISKRTVNNPSGIQSTTTYTYY